jgi:hypothetical protein
MWWLLALLGLASAEIRTVGTHQYMGCYKAKTSATFDLTAASCCDDGTPSGGNCQYCPECFLLDITGSQTFTFNNCPGKFDANTDYCSLGGGPPSACTAAFTRQYQFINIAGSPQTVTDGETTTTPVINIASGSSATVMCYNGNFYPL